MLENAMLISKNKRVLFITYLLNIIFPMTNYKIRTRIWIGRDQYLLGLPDPYRKKYLRIQNTS
jgi:hypothetical protein